MIRVRSGAGLGDSIYLRVVAERLAREQAVTALTDYPDVFFGSEVKTEPFTRALPCIAAHYPASMEVQGETQFASMLRTAGLPPDVPLRFTWNIRNVDLVRHLRAGADGLPIVLVHGGCTAMQRKDNFSADMLPRQSAFETALGALRGCYRVGIGKAERLYNLPLDEDLHGKTSVADLLDIAYACGGILAQCSFCVPLAEVFDKPLLAVWAAKGLVSSNPYIRHITSQKVLTKSTSSFAMDDWSDDNIVEETELRFLGCAVTRDPAIAGEQRPLINMRQCVS